MGAAPLGTGLSAGLELDRPFRSHSVVLDGVSAGSASDQFALRSSSECRRFGSSLREGLRSRPAAGRTVPAESAWVFWPAAFWIAGVIGIPAAAIVRRVRFSLRPLPNYDGAGAWNEELQACRRQFKVRAPIELCVTADLGPLLYWGAGGYRVVVPEPLWRQLTLPQRLAVLRHEVCHAAHRDVWRLLLVRLLALPHWFNPLAWSAVRRFEECLEARCDDAARPPGRPSTMPRRYCCWPR